MTLLKCPNCSTELKEITNFCTECGTHIYSYKKALDDIIGTIGERL